MEGVKIHHLENRAYFFSINMVSFVKTLKKVKPECNTYKLVDNAAKLADIYMDAVDLKEDKIFRTKIQECKKAVEEIQNELENIECQEKLLHEKVDLMIENQHFMNVFSDYLQNKKKETEA